MRDCARRVTVEPLCGFNVQAARVGEIISLKISLATLYAAPNSLESYVKTFEMAPLCPLAPQTPGARMTPHLDHRASLAACKMRWGPSLSTAPGAERTRCKFDARENGHV